MLQCCCKYVIEAKLAQAAQEAQDSTTAVTGGEPVLSFHCTQRYTILVIRGFCYHSTAEPNLYELLPSSRLLQDTTILSST